MQTTDELAAAAQAGTGDALELWQAVRRFAMGRAVRWHKALNGRGGVTLDDLEQAAFLALLDALASWDGNRGTFLAWYSLRLKGAFTTAAGLRTRREEQDPLEAALSLEAPLTDTVGEPFTLAEVVPDPAAEAAFSSVAERDKAQRLRAELGAALSTLPEEQRTALVSEFWHGRRADTRTRSAALRALRKPEVSRGLKAYL